VAAGRARSGPRRADHLRADRGRPRRHRTALPSTTSPRPPCSS
jgi:hypothetical protein